jgi:hypothetical protein
VTLALLSGCASFADGVQEAADVRAAGVSADQTEASTSASATTSGGAAATTQAPTSTTPTTTSPAPTTAQPPATTAGAPPASPTVAPGSQAPPAPPAGGWPPETTLTAYREAWGVYLSVAREYTDAETARMQQTYRDLQALGYRGYYGTLCDAGAESAGVGESDDAVAVYFTTKAQAEQFIGGWNRPVVGYAQVATFCTD